MKISKLPSGSYSVNLYYKIDGKPTRRRVTAATKDECRRLAADILASARASVAASVGVQSRGGWARSDGVMKSVYLHVLSSERENISRVCLDAFSDAGL